MRTPRFFNLVFLWSFALLLTACFEFEQTLYIDADGTGRSEVRYVLPINLMDRLGANIGEGGIPISREQLESQFSTKEGVHLVGGRFREQGSQRIIDIRLDFDHIEKLTQTGLRYEWTTDGDERVVRIGLDKQTSVKKLAPLQEMLLKGLDKQGARFTIHLPRKVSWSNADVADGNTVRWFIPAQWVLNPTAKPRVLEARYKITKLERAQAWFEELF